METKDMQELRNKRLSYYNKVINSNHQTTKTQNEQQENNSFIIQNNSYSIEAQKKENKTDLVAAEEKLSEIRSSRKSSFENIEPNDLYKFNTISSWSKPSEQTIKNSNSIEFLNRLFQENIEPANYSSSNSNSNNNSKQMNPIIKNNNKILRNSISMDESLPPPTPSTQNSQLRSSNRKLEEFRRVVEDSYNQHVLKKNDYHSQLSSSSDENLKNTPTPASINVSKNLFDSESSVVSFVLDTNNSINGFNNKNDKDHNNTYSFRSGETLASPIVPCKIPYMSAYNIYSNKQDQNDKLESDSQLTVIASSSSSIIAKVDEPISHKITMFDNKQTDKKWLPINKVSSHDEEDKRRSSFSIETQIFMQKHLSSIKNGVFETNDEYEIDKPNRKMSLENNNQNIGNDTKNNLKKFLSSNGSSLNNSPTSISSAESARKFTIEPDETSSCLFDENLNHNNNNSPYIPSSDLKKFPSNLTINNFQPQIITTSHQVKPPETPRTKSAGSTYRKNLLKMGKSMVIQTNNNQQNNEPINTIDQQPIGLAQKSNDPKLKIKNELITMNDDIKNFILKKRTDLSLSNEYQNNQSAANNFVESKNNKNVAAKISDNNENGNSIQINNKNDKLIKTSTDYLLKTANFKIKNKFHTISFDESLKSTDSLNSMNPNQQTIQTTNQSSSTNIEKFFTNDRIRPQQINIASSNDSNQTDSLKQVKNNYFKYIGPYTNNDTDDENDDQTTSDEKFKLDKNNNINNNNENNSDTLDIISSQDSLDSGSKENVVQFNSKPDLKLNDVNNNKTFNLTIDLGNLTEDDEDDFKFNPSSKGKNTVVDEDNFIYEHHNQNSNTNNVISLAPKSSIQQVKPDNIPNLALDLIDDDKSLSVAASLAKSMCKEIDYQKEMEVIYSLQNENDQTITNKPIKMKPIKSLNKLKTTLPPPTPTPPPSQQSQSTVKLMPSFTDNLNSSRLNSPIFINPNSVHKTSNNMNSMAIMNHHQPLASNRNKNTKQVKEFLLNKDSEFLRPPTKSNSTSRVQSARKLPIQHPVQLDSIRSSFDGTKIPATPNTNNNNKHVTPDLNKINYLNQSNENSNSFLIKSNSFYNLSKINKSFPKEKIEKIIKNPRPSSSFGSNSKENLIKEIPVKLKSSPRKSIIKNQDKFRSKSAMSQHGSDSLTNNQKSMIPSKIDRMMDDQHKTDLFFNYSKLVAIESNLEKQLNESEKDNNRSSSDLNQQIIQTRPKSAFSKLATSVVKLKFDLPPNEEPVHSISKSKLIESDSNENAKTTKQNDFISLNEDSSFLISEQPTILENNSKDEFTFKSSVDWLQLPDEIWLKILKYLKPNELALFGRCCKKFRNLYIDNSLWPTITMKYQYEMCDEWLEWIGNRRPNELNIIQCSGNITLDGITEMFRNIGDELKSLNLSRCSSGTMSGDNFTLQASIRCPNVTKLDLSWTLLSNQTLKLVADSFKKIESINLSGCSMIKDEGLNLLLLRHGEFCVLNIGVYCRILDRLNISNCHRMTNESIIEACPQWLKLKFIDLRGNKSIKNNCVSTLVRRCPNLEGLALGECIHLSDAAVLEIATYKPNLKYLDLNGCKKITDNSLRSIGNFCTKLQSLNLKATNITDIGLISLANGKCMKILEELNLSYLPIGEVVFIKILRNALKLKNVYLYGCYNIKKLNEIKSSVDGDHVKYININI